MTGLAGLDLVRSALETSGCHPRENGQGFIARCPAHDDSNPSLSVGAGRSQPVLIKCHAGCDSESVLKAMDLSWNDICDPRNGDGKDKPDITDIYEYVDETGTPLFEVVRYWPKAFKQRRPDGTWKLDGVRRVLYRLPSVLAAVQAGETVWIAEGEKDVHALQRAGATATTSPGGALKWRDDYSIYFRGANVVVVADQDEPGHAHAADVFGKLLGVAKDVKVVAPGVFGGHQAKDPAEHFGLGGTLDDFVDIKMTVSIGVKPDPERSDAEPEPTRFIGRDGLRTVKLAEAVLAGGPIRSGLGGRLWHYRAGVWLPDGEAEVHRRTKHALGDRWRRLHADTVVAWLAADEPFIADDHPTHVINCRSGLLDWRTGELRAHGPEIPSTFQVPHRWEPEATCPTVDAWLTEVLPPDAIEFAWEVLGYLLFPANPMHVVVLLFGGGRNGKGTFLHLARQLLGASHVSSLTLQSLGENRFAAADLYRKVANIAGDLDSRAIMRTDTFKMATGGDPLAAERKYGQPFTFVNRATFLFGANQLPATGDVSEGFMSRWLILPFTGFFPAGKADPSIGARLAAELPGVFVRAVQTLRRLMDRGHFAPPGSVIEATSSYRTSADPVRLFIGECLDVRPGARERRSEVYRRYVIWTEANGHRQMSAHKFYERLRQVHPEMNTDLTIRGVRMIDGACFARTDGAGCRDGVQGAGLSSPPHVRGEKGAAPAPLCTPVADPDGPHGPRSAI